MSSIAALHDDAIFATFRQLFQLPNATSWELSAQQVSFEQCRAQANLPLRLAGCGLRDSARTANAAYWASWADAVGVIRARYPPIGDRISAILQRFSFGVLGSGSPHCLRHAEDAGQTCEAAGFSWRPSWDALANGHRPPQPEPNELELGEWAHGWQYHASSALEQTSYERLRQDLALP